MGTKITPNGLVYELLRLLRRQHGQARKLKWSTDILGTNEFSTGYERGWRDAVRVAAKYWQTLNCK